jgi:FixJ family two-component response regulator
LISDVDLPDLSGTEVALALSKSNPKLPILFVSASPMNLWTRRDRCNFRRLPSALVDFLEKPFRLSTLQNKIGELLDRASTAIRSECQKHEGRLPTETR